MKISFDNDEIIVDLTESRIKQVGGDKEITLSKKNFLIPTLKGMPKTYHYYNRNKVNPYYLNCTCKEYRDSIKLYPLRDIRRMCKHIFFVLTRDFSARIDSLTNLLLEHQFWKKITDVYEINFNSEKLYLSFNKEYKFVLVYRKQVEWKFYTFFPSNDIWDNNLPPYKELENNKFLSYFIKQLYYTDIKSSLAS
ncbi:MAG: hypothetical protein WAU11_06070 [Ignavibacteriaceae bacterium]